jgi:hypothetical protein
VNVRPRNDASLAFHEAIGFREVGQQDTDGGRKRVSLLALDLSAVGGQAGAPWRPAPAAKRAAPACVSPVEIVASPMRVSADSAARRSVSHCP